MNNNMNKTYKLSALWTMCLILFSCMSFMACDNGDNEDTNQYKGGINLNVFGPSPVARGGELRFLGSGMDKVTAVILPGSDEITDIKVISSTEIRITVPQTAQPGLVVLKTPKGEITTKTPLTFTEPISIESISPVTLKAGGTLTIKGEYLNLIKEVIFADNVIVTEFVSQSRNEIKVIVPIEAAPGKVIVSDGEEIPNWIYSEEVLAVTQPVITSIAPNPLKAGQSLTIIGTDFDLVEKVILPGNAEIDVKDVATKIVVETSSNIQEGKVVLVAKSGVRVESAELVLVKPEITSLASTTVKNNGILKITGKNLDLVSEVTFQDATANEFISQSTTLLELNIPASATDGIFTLKTASMTEVEGKALTFMKPEVTKFSVSAIKAKENLVITGKNMDLVSVVAFGTVNGTIVSKSDASLTVTVPVGAASGALTLTTLNGTQVETTQKITINVTLPVITSIKSAGPGKLITIEGTELNLLKTIYLQDKQGQYTIKVTDYGMKSDTKVEFYHVKDAASGYITPMMVTVEGDEGFMPQVYCGGTDPVQDVSYVFFDFDSKGSWWGSYGKTENDPALSLDGTSYFRINQNLPSGWVDFFWRNSKNDLKTTGVTVADWVIKMDVNVIGNDTQEFKFRLNGTDGDFWAIIPGFKKSEGWYTVTIPLTDFLDGNGTGTNHLPTVDNVNADFGLATNGAAGFVNMCIDNIRFEKK